MPTFDAGAPLRSEEASSGRRIRPLVWRRLPWWGELAVILLGYLAYTRSRVAVQAKEQTAFFHASQVWDFERLLHIDIEIFVNKLVAAWGLLADVVGYYYGTLHFIVTPLVLVWLWKRRPAEYPRLRSALMVTTGIALIVYWTWPLAPPRLAIGGTVDILVTRNILHAGNPNGISSMVNLYAAMPSLHVAWASWCAFAVYTTTTGKWRKLVWLYPVATTFVVIATANHFVLDAVGAVGALAVGLYLTRPDGPPRARSLPPAGSIATAGAGAGVGTPALVSDVAHAAPLELEVSDGSDVHDPTIDVRRPTSPRPPTEH